MGTVRHDCLDHLLIFGRRQLERALAEFIDHYRHARPHQGLKQCPPCPSAGPVVPAEPDRVERRDRLGGLIHEYLQAA